MDYVPLGYGDFAETLRVLAESLPKMMKAKMKPGENMNQPLGGITENIAKHLKTEVCSIFLPIEIHGMLMLYCVEAYGYEHSVQQMKQAYNKGLTGKIYSEPMQLVLNYSVQDEDLGWLGTNDGKLQTHCWSLLGVPIISSEEKCLGVLKLENKRKSWGPETSTEGKYIKELSADPNRTPMNIEMMIQNLCNNYNKECEKLKPLARKLVEHTLKARAVIPFYNTVAARDEECKIYPKNLYANIEAIRWHIDCLHHEIDQIIRYGQNRGHLIQLAEMTHSLQLALRAYEPFNYEDLMLARHVAAMLAAVLEVESMIIIQNQTVGPTVAP
ncbi:MAG TPA: GAF domain-containing protein [Candidatus Brocadiia bacterium]|nr:GAF domain-containing protein [Candidatus Brocadiia bacterium]